MNKWEMGQKVMAGDLDVMPDFCNWVGRRSQHYARKYAFSPEITEEARVETVLRVIDHLASVDPAHGPRRGSHNNFLLWVYAIARNTAVNYRRQGLRDQKVRDSKDNEAGSDRGEIKTLEQEILAGFSDTALPDPDASFSDQMLSRLKLILKPEQYEVIKLRMEGASLGDTAAKLGISYRAAKAREHRALPHIEKHILNPAGLDRNHILADELGLRRSQVAGAYKQGTLPTIQLYPGGPHYSTRSRVQTFANRLRVIQEMEKKGYVPLSSLPQKEYRYLRFYGEDMGVVVRREGVPSLFIKARDLKRLRKERERKRHAKNQSLMTTLARP